MPGRVAAAVSLGLFALCSLATRASAVPVHLYFAGEVTSAPTYTPGPFSTLGNPISGSLEYDTDSVSVVPGPPSSYFLFPRGTLTLSGPGYSVSLPFGTVDIGDLTPGDTGPDIWRAGGTPPSLDYAFVVTLSDDSQTAVPGPGYFTPLSLAGWSRGEVSYYSTPTYPGPPAELISTITLSSWVAFVPEPSGLGLLAAATLVIRAGRRSTLRCRPRARASSPGCAGPRPRCGRP